jgi:predicted RNA-binding Zn ribbon-like protein
VKARPVAQAQVREAIRPDRKPASEFEDAVDVTSYKAAERIAAQAPLLTDEQKQRLRVLFADDRES